MKAVVIRHIKRKWLEPDEEILDLAEVAAYKVVEIIDFYANNPHPQNYLPEMKLQDLLFMIQEQDIRKVIIDTSISPTQMLSLEEQTQIEIMDKPMLVLEIFANKANSKEINLQIQLAQLRYSIPRTVSKLGEAVRSERPGFGGTGQQVTDTLVSDIKRRIRNIEFKLEEIKKNRKTEITEIPILPIIGYYSTGKSTLFNILTEDDRETGSEAFTTMLLKRGRSMVTGYAIELIDTIGLVDLPSNVLNAFELMLDSIFSFSSMIICIDSSTPSDQWSEQLQDIEKYFHEFAKENNFKIIIALTKTDLVEHTQLLKESIAKEDWLDNYRILETRMDQPEKVKNEFIAIFEDLFNDKVVQFKFQNLHPSHASKIHENTRVIDQEWLDDGKTNMTVIAPQVIIKRLMGDVNR